MDKSSNDLIYEEIEKEFKKIVKKHELQDEKVDCSIIAKGFTGRRPKARESKEFIEQHFRMPSRECAR